MLLGTWKEEFKKKNQKGDKTEEELILFLE